MSELDEEKLFYERFYSLHRDPILTRVYEAFGIGVFRRSCVLEGFDAFIRRNAFTGKRVVEIGTCHGLTALVLSRYFAEVVTIDNTPSQKKHEIAAYLGIENISFIDVADNEEKSAVIRGIDFDAAFSDGDHARDTATDFSLVERCGRVLLHENWAPQQPVVELVNALRVHGHVEADGKWALWVRSATAPAPASA